MRRRSMGRFLLALVLMVQWVTRLTAGEVSDVWSKLAGRWTLVVEKADAKAPPPHIPATASSGWGREITITTEAGRVTIERHQFAALDVQPPMLFVYLLGGAESRNTVDVGRGPQEQIAGVERQGEALVIATRHATGTELEAEVTQTFSIDPDSDDALVVETTRTANGETSSTKTRYRRQSPPSPN